MPRKKEDTSWESIVLAGDGTTWAAEDWEWDSAKLTAQPKRRSPRLEQAVAATTKAFRPCAAAARLASHLQHQDCDSLKGDDQAEAKVQQQQQRDTLEGKASKDSSSSSKSGSGKVGTGGKAQSKSKAQLASRRPVCQADGCNRDLSMLTYYHQRNRICEVHIKMDVFLREGEQLRFCQRCGHSHLLAAFDPGKHSCRKQLEKHNARRRKQQAAASVAQVAAAAGNPGDDSSIRSQDIPGTEAVGVKEEPFATQAAECPPAHSQQQLSGATAAGSRPSRGPSPSASSNSPDQTKPGAEAGAQPAWPKLNAGLMAPAVEAASEDTAPCTGACASRGCRAQERLAVRIAQLAASGADLSLLQPAGDAAPAQPPPHPASAAVQPSPAAEPTHIVHTGADLAAAAMLAPAPMLPHAELEALELPSLDELGAGILQEGIDAGAELRSMSPLLPLLDFDLEEPTTIAMLQGAADGGGSGRASVLADELSDWITSQLADQAMLCDGGAPQPAAAGQAGSSAGMASPPPPVLGVPAALVSDGDVLMSLFDDLCEPSGLPGVAGYAAGSFHPAGMQQQQLGAGFQLALPPAANLLPAQHWAPAQYHFGAPAIAVPALPQQAQPRPQGSFMLASQLMGAGAPAAPLPPPPEAQATLNKVSVKLFGCTPEELPTDLRQQLSGWFSNGLASVDGYIRPGCVHLTVQAVLQQGSGTDHGADGTAEGTTPVGAGATGSSAPQRSGVERVVSSMLESGCELWRRKTLLVQCGGELALVHDGALRKTWDVRTAAAARAVPQVHSVSPPVVARYQPGTVKLAGVNLMQDDCELLARSHGSYVALPDAGCTDCCCRAPLGAAAGGCGGSCQGEAGTGWEQRCCGCCTAKLQPGPAAAPAAGEAAAGGSATAVATAAMAAVAPVEGSQQQQQGERLAGKAQRASSTQSVRVVLPQELTPGLLYVDVQRGAFSAPQGARLLVVESEEVQQELWGLQQRLAPAAYRATLDQFGLVYEWVGSGGRRPQYELVERTAVGLLYWCVSAGMVASAEALLRLLAREAPTGVAGALERARQLACHDGLSLLHRALQSRSVVMTQAVLSWGEEAGSPWPADLQGPLGLTPLHLAAVVPHAPTSRAVLELLLCLCSGGTAVSAAAWHSVQTADGLTPQQFAGIAGTAQAAAEVLAALVAPAEEEAQEQEEQWEASVEDGSEQSLSVQQPATPRRCRCTGDCPCAAASKRCAWCEMDDSGGSSLGDTAASDCGKACGLVDGKCGCCGMGDGGTEHEGGGSGGGSQDAAQGNSGQGGCCGGGGKGAGHEPSAGGGGGGQPKSPGSVGSCGGGSRPAAGGHGSGAPRANMAANAMVGGGAACGSLGWRISEQPAEPLTLRASWQSSSAGRLPATTVASEDYQGGGVGLDCMESEPAAMPATPPKSAPSARFVVAVRADGVGCCHAAPAQCAREVQMVQMPIVSDIFAQ